jgi:CDP-diacylglycerol---glycerol-3-phosphate 3-phosphatidyltransferase
MQAADVEYAHRRLRGTVWQNWASARVAYTLVLALGRGLGSAGLSANTLTYSALFLAAGSAVAAAFAHFALAALFLALSGVCDVLDGVVARATRTNGTFGALLDSTVDRLADALPLLGLVAFYSSSWLVLVPASTMVAAFSVSYVRARSEGLGVTLPPLYMRRAERTLLLIGLLAVGEVPLPGPVPAPLVAFGIALLGILSLSGLVAALKAARRSTALASENTKTRPILH